jgi:hypothetical protein
VNDADEVKRVEPEKNRGGTWITFGSEAYRVPPLSFLKIQELQDRIAAMAAVPQGGQPTAGQMETVLDVVHAAISRNYPAMTREQLADMIDLQNYQEVLGAVLNIAGFKPQEAGSGEALASTGTGSTSP